MDMFQDIQFVRPWLLLALLALPLLWLAVLQIKPDRLGGGAVLASVKPLYRIGPGRRTRLRRLLVPLRLLALALLIVAAAEPRRARADASIETEGIDIALAYDISGSMNEPGLGAATKMEGAKAALREFLETRTNDRVGLVVFKSESRVMSPLSLDYDALKKLVDEAERQNEGLQEGTGIGLGIADALNLLRNSRSKTRVVILATDGENNERRIEPEQAAAMAEALKIRVYTVGLMAARATSSGPDEARMRRIAEQTGGSYARATDQEDFEEIISNIATLEKTRFERERLTRYSPLLIWALAPAVGLLLLEALLGATWLRRAP